MDSADALNILIKFIKGDPQGQNKTEVEPETCNDPLIEETLFYQLCLIPSVVIVLILCCTQKRRNLVLHVLKGRPGLVYPMDLTRRSHRISYACAFGSTVYLIVAGIFSNFRAFHFDGPLVLNTVILLISVLIFGIVYLPVFLCLTLGSIYGFVLGAAYTWMLTAVQLIRMSQCDYDKKTRIVLIMRNLPPCLCLFYLSCSLFGRTVQAFRSRQFGVGTIERRVQDEKMEDILESTPGKRVRILLTPSRRLEKKPEASSRLLTVVQELTYRWEPDFKYSARILSTLMVGMMVLYSIAFASIEASVSTLRGFKQYSSVLYLQRVVVASSEEEREGHRVQEEALDTFADYFSGAIIGSECLSFVLGAYGILRMFTGYRTTMYRLYRGEMKAFTQGMSNTALLVSCLKYSGFQVASIAWGFFVQSLFFVVVFGLISLAIGGYSDWIVDLFLQLWPIPLWTLIIYVLQFFLSKFFFLQDRGDFLAFDNRRALFLFSYFVFFFNIFLGLFSTVLRLLKGMVIGVLTVPRLDHSTLPLAFVHWDRGYKAYIGFMQVECSQTHPVMVSFIRLLILLSRERKNLERRSGEVSKARGHRSLPELRDREKSRKQHAAVFHWHVTYTLINNPDLRVERRGYFQTVKKARQLGVRIPTGDVINVPDSDLLREAKLEHKRARRGLLSRVADRLVAVRLILKKNSQDGTAHKRDGSGFETQTGTGEGARGEIDEIEIEIEGGGSDR